jgi:hypothetical protein
MKLFDNLINKFKELFYKESKYEIEGYTIMTDSTTDKTLVLIKNGEKSWRTKWFNNNETIYKTPSQPLHTIFITKK